MKKYNLLLVLFACLMFAVSCVEDEVEPPLPDEQQEEEEIEEEEEEQAEQACKITELSYAPGERVVFSYNADGDMASLTTYSDNEIDDKLTFTYTDGRLVKGTSESGGTVDVEYADEEISKFVYKFEGDSDIDEYRFTYTGGKLSKIENWDNYTGDVAGEFTLYGTENFTFTGDNITEYSAVDVDGETFDAVIEFDDKKNAFQNNVGYFIWELDILGFYATNNPISVEATYSDGTSTEVSTQTVAYTYNDDDYPTLRTFTDDEGDTYSDELSYTCE